MAVSEYRFALKKCICLKSFYQATIVFTITTKVAMRPFCTVSPELKMKTISIFSIMNERYEIEGFCQI